MNIISTARDVSIKTNKTCLLSAIWGGPGRARMDSCCSELAGSGGVSQVKSKTIWANKHPD